MKLIIFKDYDTLSLYAAEEIIQLVKSKPDAVIYCASGDTPRLSFKRLVKRCLNEKIDFSRVTFVGLDEWVGIPPSNEESCRYVLKKSLIDQLNLLESNIFIFNAMSEDLRQECYRMDTVISSKSGIDLMLVGLGMNGYIGFKEACASVNSYSQLKDLDKINTSVAQRYFKQAAVLGKGITLGLKHMLESKQVLVIGNSIKKANLIKKMMEEEISEKVPASIVRRHSDAKLTFFGEADSLLKK